MDPRIIVIARTLNEAHNITEFCTNYGFADKILITDGGSTDGTVTLARRFDNVEVRDVSHLQVPLEDAPGGFVTPEAEQTNILIDWAMGERVDWIIRDDIDCWPNSHLRRRARQLFATVKLPSIFVYRLYLWGEDQWFPKMSKPGQSLWAWKPAEIDIWAKEGDLLNSGVEGLPAENKRVYLEQPLVCLHYFARNEEEVQRKIAQKAAIGQKSVHPLESIYAPPQPLPDWAL